MRLGRAVALIAFVFLAVPYFLLFRFFPQIQIPDLHEFWWALKNSCLQASASAGLAVVGGLILLLGLLQAPSRWRAPFSWLLLSPSFFPPLFLLLSFLSWMDPFPVGWVGVSLVQGFMNAGLVAVLCLPIFEKKLAGLSEMARIAGASKTLFFRTIAPLIFHDLLSIAVFVFAVSFVSFSIPLVVGGGKSTTLEILIFEKIRISNEWGQALSLSLFQLVLLSGLAFLPQTQFKIQTGRGTGLHAWGSGVALALAALYVFVFWGPLLKGFLQGALAFQNLPGLFEDLISTGALTFLTSFAVGFFCLALFLLFSLGAPDNGLPKLMRGWLAPSTALLGFGFLLHSSDGSEFAYVTALTLLFFPMLYRLGMDRVVVSLEPQVETARVLGASDLLIWRKILVPQILPMAWILSGMAALWTLGEFAVGRILLEGPRTWALLSESLMSSYRIEAGLGVSALILLAGALVFFLFWRGAHVRR